MLWGPCSSYSSSNLNNVKYCLSLILRIRMKQTEEHNLNFYFHFFKTGARNGSMFRDTTQLCARLQYSDCILHLNCKLLNSATQFLSVLAQAIKVRWACRPLSWSFTSATNLGTRTIVRKPLTHFKTAMWWNTILIKPREKACFEGHDSVFRKTEVILTTNSWL
jgi:hypothetical protein